MDPQFFFNIDLKKKKKNRYRVVLNLLGNIYNL